MNTGISGAAHSGHTGASPIDANRLGNARDLAQAASLVLPAVEFTGRMTVVCNWCAVPHVMGVKPCAPEMDGEISHGVCQAQKAKFLASFRQD